MTRAAVAARRRLLESRLRPGAAATGVARRQERRIAVVRTTAILHSSTCRSDLPLLPPLLPDRI
ncbi:hypothetical protein CcI49_25645 [Frankia sp. CcI49]|nr:hypothetical protein CcI49_25645 [Frankia sp. CcI49]